MLFLTVVGQRYVGLCSNQVTGWGIARESGLSRDLHTRRMVCGLETSESAGLRVASPFSVRRCDNDLALTASR